MDAFLKLLTSIVTLVVTLLGLRKLKQKIDDDVIEHSLKTKVLAPQILAEITRDVEAARGLILTAVNGIGDDLDVTIVKQSARTIGEVEGWGIGQKMGYDYRNMLYKAWKARSKGDPWIYLNTPDIQSNTLRDMYKEHGITHGIVAVIQRRRVAGRVELRYLALQWTDGQTRHPVARTNKIRAGVNKLKQCYEGKLDE